MHEKKKDLSYTQFSQVGQKRARGWEEQHGAPLLAFPPLQSAFLLHGNFSLRQLLCARPQHLSAMQSYMDRTQIQQMAKLVEKNPITLNHAWQFTKVHFPLRANGALGS